MRKGRKAADGKLRGRVFGVPERLCRSLAAAAGVLGCSEQDIVEGGIVLYCTYVLNRVQPAFESSSAVESEVKKWDPGELVSALASRCVSARKRRGGLRGAHGVTAGLSEIMSVGSVLRTLHGERAKGRRGGGSSG